MTSMFEVPQGAIVAFALWLAWLAWKSLTFRSAEATVGPDHNRMVRFSYRETATKAFTVFSVMVLGCVISGKLLGPIVLFRFLTTTLSVAGVIIIIHIVIKGRELALMRRGEAHENWTMHQKWHERSVERLIKIVIAELLTVEAFGIFLPSIHSHPPVIFPTHLACSIAFVASLTIIWLRFHRGENRPSAAIRRIGYYLCATSGTAMFVLGTYMAWHSVAAP